MATRAEGELDAMSEQLKNSLFAPSGRALHCTSLQQHAASKYSRAPQLVRDHIENGVISQRLQGTWRSNHLLVCRRNASHVEPLPVHARKRSRSPEGAAFRCSCLYQQPSLIV